ncbi:beta-glucosidase 12-like [Actinidia eriantha]|uniref:beta-glucosidase 12-like n=1 Tax=Actinidia eriantha TaxID=165200 RepID=UPI002587690F|nr:beta-glucosidase 12-like [Actinidia eriantha]
MSEYGGGDLWFPSQGRPRVFPKGIWSFELEWAKKHLLRVPKLRFSMGVTNLRRPPTPHPTTGPGVGGRIKSLAMDGHGHGGMTGVRDNDRGHAVAIHAPSRLLLVGLSGLMQLLCAICVIPYSESKDDREAAKQQLNSCSGGNLSGGVKQEGIRHYNNLINELVANGIEFFVNLFHWDLPQALEDEYGGFSSPQVVVDFRDYTDIFFWEFGDQVKYWITLNEPWSFCSGGYDFVGLAPGRCSSWPQRNCTVGDSGIEPYLVGHNQLLAHAAVARLYKQNYQASQKGKIGITLETRWAVPWSNATQDHDAAFNGGAKILG